MPAESPQASVPKAMRTQCRSVDGGALAGAAAWRRLVAYLVDYLLFMVPLLGILGLAGWTLTSFDVNPFFNKAWRNHGITLLVLTLPIVMYFALSESSRWQATAGKRLLGIVVATTNGGRVTFQRTVIRSAVKFLPWEFFHSIYWHWEGWPANPAPPSTFQTAALIIGWIMVGWVLVSLFVGTRRTPYDWAAGTIVIARRRTPNRTGVNRD